MNKAGIKETKELAKKFLAAAQRTTSLFTEDVIEAIAGESSPLNIAIDTLEIVFENLTKEEAEVLKASEVYKDISFFFMLGYEILYRRVSGKTGKQARKLVEMLEFYASRLANFDEEWADDEEEQVDDDDEELVID